MSDYSTQQKQLQLLRSIFHELEKRSLELLQYEWPEQEMQNRRANGKPNSSSLLPPEVGAEARVPARSFATTRYAGRDVDAIADLNVLESVLLEYVTFLEQQFLPQALPSQEESLSLLKRAMILLKYMQTRLEQDQDTRTAPSRPLDTASGTWGNEARHDGEPASAQRSTRLSPPPLHSMLREQGIPLSFAQQRLWFLEQLNPGQPLYNEYVALRLKGPLRFEALESSFNEIVRRHEILRTMFIQVDGETRQRIAAWHPRELPLITLQDRLPQEREASARRMAELEVEQPFDFVNGPLCKMLLFELAEDDHLLLIKFHQTVGDGWSMGIFFRELSTIYRACCAGEASPLAEPSIQYADYTLWQQQWLREEILQKQLDYWQQQLQDIPTHLNLPTDRPRPSVPGYAGAQQTALLPANLLQQLKALSQREHVTLFVTLLSAFYVLLMRYSGQQDILVGSPITNRTRLELEDVMGFFVNTLVLRADLSGNPSFRQLLGRVRETALQAFAHRDLPFEKLVARMSSERYLSHQPLFQVAFILQNFPSVTLDLPGIACSRLELAKTTAKFDLVVTLNEVGDELLTTVEYSTDLFDALTIERLLGHWQVLLEAVARNAGEHIEHLPLLTKTEHQLMLDSYVQVDSQTRPANYVQQVFEQQVEQTPDNIALAFDSVALTYQELNMRANQLAHYLRNWPLASAQYAEEASGEKRGVGPGTVVGLCLERSLEMIIGILGILKAGGAFLPIDPAYPQERQAFMLQDAQVSGLLTQQRVLPKLPGHGAAVLCLDADWGTIASERPTNPLSNTHPGDPAYLIYTSGSTGRPKGVLVAHEGVCNLARTQCSIFEVVPGCRVLQFASCSFDAFVSEIFMALHSGATLHLVTRDVLLPGPDLLQLFDQQAITHVTLPPSLVAAFPPTTQLALQALIVAGEVCPEEVIRRWADRTRLFNAYGPTEGTVCATCAQCISELQKPTIIGRPIAHVEVYLLDSHLQLVPIGVPGELYIGGIGLAYGYLNRADLTAERFIPHPFSHQEGKRLYRTGDLARYQHDGSIMFLGRVDRQVKLRGFRIEPEEIEAVLSRHPAVQQSAVVFQEDEFGEKRLAAFVALAQDGPGLKAQPAELWPSVAEYFVYDELLYFAMSHDERRNRSYRAAINQLVFDKVVVDIGTGKDAILARFCIEGGAKRVYAIEILEETYKQARACVQSLGLEERIIVIHGDSTQVQLPEKVDVCVSEIVGSIGGSEGAVCILNDAWRFLKPGGSMIPARSVTRIAAISLPADLAREPGFTEQTAGYVEKIFAQVGYQFDLRLCVKHLSPEDLMSSTGIFEDLDFTSYIESNYCREVVLTIHKSARLDGFLVWLNLYTIEGEEIDTLRDEYCWLPVYLPLFYPGIDVSQGDTIEMTCRGVLSDNRLNPDYMLKGHISRKNGESIPFEYTSFHHKAIFKGNAFYRELFSQNMIKKRPTETSSVDELRNYLKERVPAYMIPGSLSIVDALPLMPNGKVDLQSLSKTAAKSTPSSANYIPPRTATEQALVRLWQDVLELDRVGIHDNFFDLGGHSLLLGRIHDGLKSALGKEVSMMDLFNHPTISSLIKYCSQEQEEESFQRSHERARMRQASRQRPKRTRQKSLPATGQQGVEDE